MTENICLKALSGLAVPRMVALDAGIFSRSLSLEAPVLHTVKIMSGERPLDEIGLTPWQSVGAWAFIVEQLVAFRRHGVLFSDISCFNIMGAKKPLRILFVEFGLATPLVRGQRVFENRGYTPGAEAPEIAQGRRLTERSMVFVAAALLVNLMTRLDTSELYGRDFGGLLVTQQRLARMGMPGLAKVLGAALALEPAKRPKNFESLLKAVRAVPMAPRSQNIWDRLRAPYAAYLASGGM